MALVDEEDHVRVDPTGRATGRAKSGGATARGVRSRLGIGTAYRIRTGDLRLERAVSWASRRMRPRRRGRMTAGPVGMIPAGSRHGPAPNPAYARHSAIAVIPPEDAGSRARLGSPRSG